MGPVLWVWSEQLPSKCPASFLAPWAAQETLEGQYLILFSWFLAAHGDLSGTLLCSKEWEFRGCARWSWEMFVLAQTHCLDWRGLIPLWIPAFKRAPHRDEFWPAAHRDRRRKLQQCHPALHCQEPPWYIIHCPDFLWHRCQGWGLWAHCRYMFIFGIWFWVFDWKQKEVLSSDLQSVLAKRPRLPMPLTLNTGAVAGSCSLWGLAPREMGLVLSESCQQRFLLAPGYETQLCGITEQGGRKAPSQVWGAHTQSRGVWAAHKQTDLHSCTETTWDPRLLSGFSAGLCLRPAGKMTAMRIFWSCRVLHLQKQHKFAKGPNHSQSVKKQDRDKGRGKIEMYCMAIILGYEFTF